MSRRARAQISCSRYLCVCDIGKDALNCLVLTYCDLQNNLEVPIRSYVVNSRHVRGAVAKWKLPTYAPSIPQSNGHRDNRGNRSSRQLKSDLNNK